MKLLVLLLLAATPAWAVTGWDSGNAGDTFANEFYLTGKDVVQRLELLLVNNQPVFDTRKLRNAIERADVHSYPEVLLNGNPVDAKNYPPDAKTGNVNGLIEVSQDHWRFLRRAVNTKPRMKVVLHEYLWISGVDDTNFTTSTYLTDLLNITNYSPNVWWNPVNPANYLSVRLSFAPDGCAFGAGHFDVRKTDEVLTMEPEGECGDDYRKLVVTKSTGTTPASSLIHGYYHMYDMSVYDRAGQELAKMRFEPTWGNCLQPDQGACQVSGKMSLGGIETIFQFLRN